MVLLESKVKSTENDSHRLFQIDSMAIGPSRYQVQQFLNCITDI